MSNNSKISNRTSKNILLGCLSAFLLVSCVQNEGWEPSKDSGKPNTQPVTKPTPQPEPTPTTNQGQFLGLFAADITTDGQNITSSEVRPLSTGAALENIVLSVDNTINLKDDKTGIKHYLTTLNVINKSNKDIATPTFVPVATSRTNNTFFHGAKDKSGQASDPAGIIIEQGHHNSAGNIVVNPTASKLAAVNFAASSIVPKAGDKITKVSGKAWQSAALAQNASQKVQLGFMIPKTNNTFRFTMLFAVMDSGVTKNTDARAKEVNNAVEFFKNDPKLSQDPTIKALLDYKGDRHAVEYITLKDNSKVPLLSNATSILSTLEHEKGMKDQGQQFKRYASYYPMLPKKIQAKYPTPDQAKSMSAEQIVNTLNRIEADSEYTVEVAIGPVNKVKTQGISALNTSSSKSKICQENADPNGICKNFDWPLKYWTSPVKNQGKRMTCWAFSAVALLESREMVQNGYTPNLSEQYVVYKVKAEHKNRGWLNLSNTLNYLIHDQENGSTEFATKLFSEKGWTVPTNTGLWAYRSKFPYTAGYPPCKANTISADGKSCEPDYNRTYSGEGPEFNSSISIDVGNQNEIIKNLNKGRAVSIELPYVSEYVHNSTHKGHKYKMKKGDPIKATNHSVVIIGFVPNELIKKHNKTTNHKIPLAEEYKRDFIDVVGHLKGKIQQGYYVIKNSWGTDRHGDAGLDYLSVGFVTKLGRNARVLNFTPKDHAFKSNCKGNFFVDQYDTKGDLEKLKHCSGILGILQIQNTDLINLDGLRSLTKIGGGLIVTDNNSLTNLDGLKNITTVSGYLSVTDNNSLENLDGLQNITTVGGKLYVHGNDSLTNLDGLKNITTVGGDLYVDQNNSLTNLDGLQNITTVGGDLAVGRSNSLTNLDGLQNITTVGGDLVVGRNNSLISLDGLQNIKEVKGDKRMIYNNPKLDCTPYNNNPFAFFPLTYSTGNKVNCGDKPEPTFEVCKGNFIVDDVDTAGDIEKIKNCKEITGNLKVHKTKLTNLKGLENLTKIGRYLHVIDNRNLTNLDGLKNITTVGGNLYVFGNSSLTNLNGLKNITTIGGFLYVKSNSSLVNLDGLKNITTVGGDLGVTFNNSLTNLDGLKNITTVSGSLDVIGNDSLTNLDGLKNLAKIGQSYGIGLYIISNKNLTNLDGLRNIKEVKGERREIDQNPKLDCTPYNNKPFTFFPLTKSTGNKVNCTTK